MIKRLSRPLIFVFCVQLGSNVSALNKDKTDPTNQQKDETTTSLSHRVLAFPYNNDDYKSKIIETSGSYVIWHQKKIKSWTQSQGFSITENSSVDDLQFNRGIIFKPPGLFFELGIKTHDISEEYRLGWILNLDMGFFREDQNKDTISTNFKYYDNLIRYKIFVNDIHFKTVEIGYGRTTSSPVKLRIPFIRNREGRVVVKIKIANRPDNFGILYDASLTKEMR